MNMRLAAVVSVAFFLVTSDMLGARERAITDSFKGMERVIREQRSRRDKLEKKRSTLAAGVTRVESVVERYIEALDRDRKALAAIDAEIAQSNAILNELSLQQVQVIEQSRSVTSTLSAADAPPVEPRSKPLPARQEI